MCALAANTPTPGALAASQTLAHPVPLIQPEAGAYQAIFELHPEPMWICDPQSLRFLAVNRAALLLYGYSSEEFLSRSLESLFSADGLAAFLAIVKRNPAGELTPSTFQHQTSSGAALEVETQTRTILFEGREAWLVVARDVTAHRDAENLLSTRYAMTRLLSENSSYGTLRKALRCLGQSFGFEAAELWTMNEEGSWFSCYAGWYGPGADLTEAGQPAPRVPGTPGSGILAQVVSDGYARTIEDVLTEPGYRERLPTLERSGLVAGIAFAIRSHSSISSVAVLLTRSRKLPDRHSLQWIAETGAQMGFAIERQKAEQELRKADETFQAFFEDAPVPYHEIDHLGTIVRVNRAECELLGRDASEIIGRPVWELVAPEEREESRVSVMRTLRERRSIPPFERKYCVRNGEEAVMRVHARPILGPAGEMIGIRNAMLDLTEAKRSRMQIELQTSLLDQVQDAIIAVDAEFRILYYNHAAERLFGWSATEAAGRLYGSIAGTQVSSAEREAIHQEILRRGSWNGEIICTNRAGTHFVVHVSWSVIRDAHGNLLRVIGIHRDLTAPKQMEQALRATEDRLRLAQDALGVGTWEWDFATGIRRCSDQFLRLFGFPGTAEEFTIEEWTQRVHPEDRALLGLEPEALYNGRQPSATQFRVVWPDRSIHWLLDRYMVARDANGIPVRAVGVSVDITEQKLTEGAIAQLAAIVECADAAIISTNLRGEVITWNHGAERMHGYKAAEVIGRTAGFLVPPDRMEEWMAVQERWRRGESIHHLETVRLTKSGESLHVLMTTSPIRDRNGEVMGMAGVAWDITQIKELQRQLAHTQKLESIGQLAAGIAHEINTPIQYIGDNAKFLEDAFRDLVRLAQAEGAPVEASGSDAGLGPPEPLDYGMFEYLREEVPKAISQLLEGVDHVAGIVRAMKEFSHPGPVEKMPVDLNQAIESTILVSKNEWKYVAEVTTELDRTLPAVPCLAGEFNQVMLNLIVNAAHAIAEVNQTSGSKGAIHISTRQNGPWVEVRLTDTGCGIPRSIQSKVFDPFFTTKPVGKGTGQGLAIAHSVIVQKHHGTIQFESEPGRGTTFLIQLPLEWQESDGPEENP